MDQSSKRVDGTGETHGVRPGDKLKRDHSKRYGIQLENQLRVQGFMKSKRFQPRQQRCQKFWLADGSSLHLDSSTDGETGEVIAQRGKVPGSVFEGNFPSVELIRERIPRIDPDVEIIGGSIVELDRSASVNGRSISEVERLQNPSDGRINPGCHDGRRKIRFKIFNDQLILTEITIELAGAEAFVPDDPDLIEPDRVVPDFAIGGSRVQKCTAKFRFSKPDWSAARYLREFRGCP